MKKVSKNKNLLNSDSGNEQKISLEGYPQFPEKEDIYNKSKRKERKNTEGGKGRTSDGEVFGNDIFGDESDIPDFELDDQQVDIGSEDEENNYYNKVGDRH